MIKVTKNTGRYDKIRANIKRLQEEANQSFISARELESYLTGVLKLRNNTNNFDSEVMGLLKAARLSREAEYKS